MPEAADPEVISDIELALPLNRCSAWESGPYATPGQHSRADSDGVGVGALTLRM